MHRILRRCLALALGTAIATTLVGSWLACRTSTELSIVGLDGYFGSHPALESEASQRAAELEAEIERIGPHPWAGRYTSPDLYPEVLLLAPEGGFTIYVNSGCGNCTGYEAFGSVRELAPDRLELVPEEAHWARYMRSDEPQALHLLEWNGVRMAVLEEQVEDFCAGLTSRASMPDAYVRRPDGHVQERDEPCPSGRPTLPAPLLALAPERPIACAISELIEPTTGSHDAVDALFRLDRGSEAGLAVGMRLRVEGCKGSGRVESAEPGRATLRLWAGGDSRPRPEDLVGRSARTLHP